MINAEALIKYIRRTFTDAISVDIRKLGSGVQGSGFLIEIETSAGIESYVVKKLNPEGLGHDYPSDRAAVFLLDLEEYGALPHHVRAIDVLAEMQDGFVKSIGGGREYYLLMEKANGVDYFNDLRQFASKNQLDVSDMSKIKEMAQYLAKIHSVKKQSRTLYWRKIRDTIGHGECLMGVFDTYPDGIISYAEMAEVEKLCIDWRARLKNKDYRLSQIHGDFHPGNIWFINEREFILLDRSRGAWGEPADDLTALAVNYIFFSLRYHSVIKGAYLEGLRLFFDEYTVASNDPEVLTVMAPFFAFRGVVVANPVFYPDISPDVREKLFRFVRNVLIADAFETDRVNEYIGM
jgi:hypothetical protein